MTPARASAARARGSSRTGERLRRLLAIVPYVLRHPGTELDELSRLFGVGREDLVRDLNVLLVTGVPPFYPHQMVDVEIDEERVWISAADHLSDPVRLTRDEALALYLQGKALLGAPGLAESGDLASALAKLESALQESLGGLAGGVEVAAGPSAERERAVLDAVRAAVADRERLAIRYYSASRDEVTNRRIDPEHVFAALGHWYVAAWDPDAGGERLFRLDRIHGTEPAGETFEPRGLAGAGRPLYSRTDADIPVRLVLRPQARWVAEYYEVEDERERDDGSLEVTLPTKDLAWVAKLLLRLGGRASVLHPPELAEAARRLAEQTLEAYR
ncbi:MAG TPA: WYL domain-containing protein [Actinomycetota bacterium]|nr:WYL domain-containing protein [Actinomycetota bacterium]